MISASLVVEGHGPPYMTYPPEHYGPPPKPEFARPLPKTRYNGAPSLSINRPSMPPTSSPRSKFDTGSPGPVNLVQSKDDLPSPRHYPQPPPPQQHHYIPFPHGLPYGGLYTPYLSLQQLRPGFGPTPPVSHPAMTLPSMPQVTLEPYSPPQIPSTVPTQGFLPPVDPHSPPALPGQSHLRNQPGFKVPSGKEGSLKHRILRPPSGTAVKSKPRSPTTCHMTGNLSNGLVPPASPSHPMGAHAPPTSIVRSSNNNNNVYNSFSKGSLIELSNGELRRVEDMRTEDFVQSAEKNPKLRLAESTVVRILENPVLNAVTLTLSYNNHRSRVEFESTLEHPLFVYGQGWASCAPDRTLQLYGLKCNRLQVGDICISLTPREFPNTTTASASSACCKRDVPQNLTTHHLYQDRSHTILTTATTTAMTVRPTATTASGVFTHPNPHLQHMTGAAQHLNRTLSADAASEATNCKKRRWSAPDNISDDHTKQNGKKSKD